MEVLREMEADADANANNHSGDNFKRFVSQATPSSRPDSGDDHEEFCGAVLGVQQSEEAAGPSAAGGGDGGGRQRLSLCKGLQTFSYKQLLQQHQLSFP